MVDVATRTWEPDEAAKAEVLRLYDASIEAGAPRTGADIARELEGLKPRWTQKVIRAAVAARTKAAKADAKRTAAATTVPAAAAATAVAPRKATRARAQSAPASEEAPPHKGRRGLVVAWFVFALGLIVSIASNVGHVLIVVRPDDELVRFGSMVMAGLWPVLLAAAVEVVSRVAWPQSWRWWLPGYVGAGLVGLIAFAISYQHLHGLLLEFGESGLTALLGPIALDLTIVVAGVALLAIGESRKATASA